jgi:hypothetical protein
VTPFFFGAESDGDRAETAYMALRERSRIAVGCSASPRRIFKLDCRYAGSDCEIEVGRPLPHGDAVVVAILDHGRQEAYAVYTLDARESPLRVARPVYAVTDFALS